MRRVGRSTFFVYYIALLRSGILDGALEWLSGFAFRRISCFGAGTTSTVLAHALLLSSFRAYFRQVHHLVPVIPRRRVMWLVRALYRGVRLETTRDLGTGLQPRTVDLTIERIYKIGTMYVHIRESAVFCSQELIRGRPSLEDYRNRMIDLRTRKAGMRLHYPITDGDRVITQITHPFQYLHQHRLCLID